MGGDARRDSLAFFHYKLGETYTLQGDTTRAIQAFRETIRWNPRFSRGYHRLAQLYLGLGTLSNRIQARRALDEALRLEPDNVSYLHTKVQLYLKIETYGLAQGVLKKILKIDPDDAEAHFLLGFVSENEWFRYRDMISPQEDGIVLSLADYAAEDLERAEAYYIEVIRLDPRFSDAYYRLALLYYETELFDQMVTVLRDALKVDAHNKDYHLFLGLAHYRMGRIQEAWSAYERTKALMEPEALAVFEAMDLVSTPDEGKAYRRASGTEKERLRYAFWKQRDPLFLTELNERKLEHYGRVAYANLRFSRVRRGIEGWKTDPGKVFIRYGAPEVRYKTRPYITVSMGRGNPIVFSQDVWRYPGFEFVFEDRNLSEDYTFKWGDPDYLVAFNRMIQNQPEAYDYVPQERRFDVVGCVACFRGGEGGSVLEMYQGFSEQKLPLTRGVFLFDEDWKEVQKRVVDAAYFNRSEEDGFLVGWDRMEVLPGTYHLAVEFVEPEGERVGRWLEDVTVEAYDERRLSMSDLILAREITDVREEGELRRGGKRIVPNPLLTYRVFSSIPVYFEVYNLTYSPGGTTHYRVTFTLQSERKEGGFTGFVRGLFGRRKSSGRVVTSYEYQGNRRDETIHQHLVLENPLPQDYRLGVEVVDLNTAEKVVEQTAFTLTKPAGS